MKVALFVTCLVDQIKPEVGAASVRVLRRAGCDVTFDPRQTCCAQPAFNSGYREEARAVAREFLEIYDPINGDIDAIVMPSGSCAAMAHHYDDLFADEPETLARAHRVSKKTFELCTFLVRELGIEDLGSRFDGRVAVHDSCHGLRDLGIKREPRKLLDNVRGVEWVDLDCTDTCCGFGGTFSVKHPDISTAILDRKLEGLEERDVDAVVSADVSCLMHIGGRMQRIGSRAKAMHVAELLASGWETGA